MKVIHCNKIVPERIISGRKKLRLAMFFRSMAYWCRWGTTIWLS